MAGAHTRCDGTAAWRELRRHQAYAACVNASVETAVKTIDSQRLQALHAERKSARSVG